MPVWLEEDRMHHWLCDTCGAKVVRQRPKGVRWVKLRMPPPMKEEGWQLKRGQRGEWEVLCPGCAEFTAWEMYRREYE